MVRVLRSVGLALLLVGVVLVNPTPAHAITAAAQIYGITPDNRLVRFASGTPGVIIDTKSIVGLSDGEHFVGIDARPANGKLYGLGSTGRLFVINPNSGHAFAVSDTPISPSLNGTEFGFDFNPVADRIRVTSDGDQNLRINPDTGAVAGTDAALAYAGADANFAANPNVVASAYTNNVDGASSTTLYNLDSGTDDLATQNPPNSGTLNTVGSTGVDIPSVTGFDIDTDGGAWAVTTVGGNSTLRTVNLSTGAATTVGAVGREITDIAVRYPQPAGDGYVLTGLDGGVFNYGSAQFKGSAGSLDLNSPVIDIEARSTGQGYWLAAADGGVFNYGDAQFYGSAGSEKLAAPIVGIAAHPSNKGYWLVAADGGVFAYGGAQFYGSMGGQTLNAEIVAIAPTPTGHGYRLFAADGGVFCFGDAQFYGSAGSLHLNAPVLGGEVASTDTGYYLVASDGGVFSYGYAQFSGSTGSMHLNAPVIKMAVDSDPTGYWLVAADGGVFAFDAQYKGSAGSTRLNAPMIGIAAK